MSLIGLVIVMQLPKEHGLGQMEAALLILIPPGVPFGQAENQIMQVE